jgi:hypothetical protein
VHALQGADARARAACTWWSWPWRRAATGARSGLAPRPRRAQRTPKRTDEAQRDGDALACNSRRHRSRLRGPARSRRARPQR